MTYGIVLILLTAIIYIGLYMSFISSSVFNSTFCTFGEGHSNNGASILYFKVLTLLLGHLRFFVK